MLFLFHFSLSLSLSLSLSIAYLLTFSLALNRRISRAFPIETEALQFKAEALHFENSFRRSMFANEARK